MTFWDIANSRLLWILVGTGLAYVFCLSGAFMVKAWRRCLALGIDNAKVKKVVASSLTFTVVPSLAIVIGVLTLSTVMGTAWSWFRLSVVGSVTYELMAADIVAGAMGFETLTAARNEPAVVMAAVMFVMSMGILSGNLCNLFFAKKISTSVASYNKKSGAWGALFAGCFMMAMVTVFVVVQAFNGPVSILTLLTSIVTAAALAIISSKFKIAWLGNFILAITLLVGMLSSILWQNLVG